MLKHIVMWKLKAEAEGKTKAENALWMKEHLEALVGVVPEIRSLEVGINIKESAMAYDAVLVSTFDDEAALEAYKVNPEHVKISTYCKKIRESRVVVDYLI
ncbi:MAG: Dabb family protein [Tannerellaceae bacterium]|nr:Dabb family protein [Tannerellaceae bacterium]